MQRRERDGTTNTWLARYTVFLLVSVFFVVFLRQESTPPAFGGERVALAVSRQSVIHHVCDDSCATAKNGICEDGSDAGEDEVTVICDLGTDCSDCGTWVTKAPSEERLPKDNIKTLNDQKHKLFLRKTVTEPPFLMAYTDFNLDNDVSGQMHNFRMVEGGLTALWTDPLKRCCRANPNKPGLVLDVGGNFGWYALYSAKMGCRVITWEPIPHYRQFLEYGVVANNLTDLVEIRAHVVGVRSGEVYEMIAPEAGNWGVASIDGHNIGGPKDHLEKIKVTGERLDDVVDEDVCVLKVDVEGFEADVFDSAVKLTQNNMIHNMFMEYTPGAWEHRNNSELYRLTNVLLDYLDRGYNIRHVPDRVSKHPRESTEVLKLIKKEHVELDRQDIKDFEGGKLGCSLLSEELFNKYNELGFCQKYPPSAHPRSFRAEFGFNTNIWAIRSEEDELPKDDVVGILRPTEPTSQYFTSSAFGMGGVHCPNVLPQDQLFVRCPCSNETVCGGETKLLFVEWGAAAFAEE